MTKKLIEVVIDTNENTNHRLVSELCREKILLVPEPLAVGDFCIPPYIIERKEYSDFISKKRRFLNWED